MSLTDAEVMTLAEQIRERARAFMEEAAAAAEDYRNFGKLTGMASSLNWAARELCLCAGVDLTRRPDSQPGSNGAALARRRLYRLAHFDSDRRCIQVGRARASFEAAVDGAQEYNPIRQDARMPAFTHVVVYEQVEVVELTELDLDDPGPGTGG